VENNSRWLGIPNRYFILLFIIISVVVFYVLEVGVNSPYVVLPAEIVFHISDEANFHITNTIVATILADIVLILLALGVRRAAKSGSLVPKGISGAVEGLLEVIYNLTESTAGKYTLKIFPYFATITLLVLVLNAWSARRRHARTLADVKLMSEAVRNEKSPTVRRTS